MFSLVTIHNTLCCSMSQIVLYLRFRSVRRPSRKALISKEQTNEGCLAVSSNQQDSKQIFICMTLFSLFYSLYSELTTEILFNYSEYLNQTEEAKHRLSTLAVCLPPVPSVLSALLRSLSWTGNLSVKADNMQPVC